MAEDPPTAGTPVIGLLGRLVVGRDDTSAAGAAPGGRRARVLLAALALAEGPVTGERLAELLWPQGPPPTWRAALRGVVLTVRTALAPLGLDGQQLIVTLPSGYCLVPTARSDVRIAADLTIEAEALVRQGAYERAAELAARAARLRGEDLLPGEDGQWLEEQRRAVDAIRLRGLFVLAEAAGAAGDHSPAIAAARLAVAQAPLDERTHRSLIRALDRAGNRAGAIEAFGHCRSLLAEQLGVDPSRETADAYLNAIRDPAPVRPAGRVPVEQGMFVPREEQSRKLQTALSRPGLVTITGRGGTGKTRLAQRAARQAITSGVVVHWVALGAVQDDELAGSVIATALGAQIGTGDPLEAAVALLAPLDRALLVLDGCESVVDGAATLVSELLTRCPGLTALVTSRSALGIPGERMVQLEPFSPPRGEDLAELVGHPAVVLLRERVREGGGELPVDAGTAGLVAALCARCGGLPLALELAAAQLVGMSLGDLLDHLDDSADDDRLRLVMLRSHALLSGAEATVFQRLSVLQGPAGLALIKQVVCDDDLPPVRVVRLLRELTAHGLLSVDTTRPYWRYHQDDDIRRLADSLLDAAQDTRPTYARLAAAVRALLPEDPQSPPGPFAAQVTNSLDALRSLLLASATGRGSRDDGLEIAFRLHRYWAASNVTEGRYWLQRLLAADHGESRWTGLATFASGYLGYWAGDARHAVADLERAAELLDEGQNGYRTRALIYLAGLTDDLDDSERAVECVRRAMRAAAGLGPDLRVAAAMGLGCVLAERADPEAARHAAEAIALCRAHATREQLATSLPTAAMVAWQVGDLDGARAYIAEAGPLLAGTRRIARVVLLSASAGVALADGRTADAVNDARIADEEAADLGVEREVPLLRSLLALALLAAGDLAGAAEQAVAAIRSARELSYDFPLAGCLEAAVLIARAAGVGTSEDLSGLLSHAAELRARGARPGPPSMREAVRQAFDALAVQGARPDRPGGMDQAEAAATATAVLERVAGRRYPAITAPWSTGRSA